MTIDDMKSRRINLSETIKMRQTALASEMHLTDDSTDAEWDALSEKLSEMPEYTERTALTVAIEQIEAREIQERIAARASEQTRICPRHHIALTHGRCDECDDWDN